MSFMLYEVWTEDDDGHQELIETTASKTEAVNLAKQAIIDGAVAVTIFQETDDGDSAEIQRFEST
jgi:hypothetical protein